MRDHLNSLSHWLVATFLLIPFSTLFAQRVQLVWTPSGSPDVVRHGIYRTAHPDSTFQLLNIVSLPDSTYADNQVQWNVHYFYTATALDPFGNESGFSNVVDTLMSLPTPVGLLAFTARVEKTDIVLEWQVATDVNLQTFEVQRSKATTSNFVKIGYVSFDNSGGSRGHYRFVDEDLELGTYFYRLKLIELGGNHDFSPSAQVVSAKLDEFYLYQNHPNPLNSFTPTTIISYTLLQSSHVKLVIYDMNGREVYRLVDAFQEAGRYEVDWEGTDFRGERVASGNYYYKIEALKSAKFRKMMVLR